MPRLLLLVLNVVPKAALSAFVMAWAAVVAAMPRAVQCVFGVCYIKDTLLLPLL